MTEEEKQDIVRGLEFTISTYTKLIERTAIAARNHGTYLTFLKTIEPEKSHDEFDQLIVLNDFSGYTLYSLLDLCVSVKGFLEAKSVWDQIFHLKHGYLIIFESLDTYYLHNTSMNTLLNGKYAGMKPAYEKIAADIKAYNKKHGDRQARAERRNSIIAHIGTNFQTYYEGILKLSGNEGFDAQLSFIGILQNLQRFLSEFVSQTNIQWKEEGQAYTKRVEEKMGEIERKFEQLGVDTAEMKEQKEAILKMWESIKKNFESF
jgi:hypothetical protein